MRRVSKIREARREHSSLKENNRGRPPLVEMGFLAMCLHWLSLLVQRLFNNASISPSTFFVLHSMKNSYCAVVVVVFDSFKTYAECKMHRILHLPNQKESVVCRLVCNQLGSRALPPSVTMKIRNNTMKK